MKSKNIMPYMHSVYAKVNLHLQLNAEIIIRYDNFPKPYHKKNYQGIYMGSITPELTLVHEIYIHPAYGICKKTIQEILVHELVHAWQIENGYKTKHGNGSGFVSWKEFFLSYYGIEI